LLGNRAIEEIRPATNVASDRLRRYEIDPQALVDAFRAAREGGPEVIGYYHSHPQGPGEPSGIDRALAAGDGKVWAIVAERDVTFWRDDGHGFAPLSYVVEDR
jgi:proteasome lid subunit RPN8/RPN11